MEMRWDDVSIYVSFGNIYIYIYPIRMYVNLRLCGMNRSVSLSGINPLTHTHILTYIYIYPKIQRGKLLLHIYIYM